MLPGDAPGEFTLRFDGYRGPSDLLAVLVREGDLAPTRVPLQALADGAAAVPDGGGEATVGQVGALRALTEIWRVRLAAATGLARLEDGEEETGGEPFDLDPALAAAVAQLRLAEGTARARLGGRPAPPPAIRLGGGEDLWRAMAAVAARQDRRGRAERLWPLPPRVPVMHHMRRVLTALRYAPRVRLIAAGASTGDAVAATLAALELVRRGRARIWQRRAYAPVVVLRPGPGRGPEEAAE